MHSALIADLASQRAAELRATAARRRDETPAPPAVPPPSIKQRAGWALIQAGLWLAVRSG
jgi:hypothetical protein